MTSSTHTQLPSEAWTLRAKKHLALIEPYADAFVKRRGLGIKDGVHDFLFTYYSCSPAKLKQWVPSFEEDLMITPHLSDAHPWLGDPWFCNNETLLSMNRERLHENVYKLASFVAELCDNILNRAPRFGCFGLHEWAMVYRLSQDEVRHHGYRLRLPPKELAAFVESQRICCTHYDAYRFFTEEARPLNTLNPVLETRLQMEQAGCVHANMDLYKWSTKLWPWIGSDFIAKTFFHALEGRELDMRASPYDLEDLGYAPICIETEEGRRHYQQEQQRLTERSTPLRIELRAFCKRLALNQI